MINQAQIQRMIELEEYTRLADRILTNGRCPSLAARKLLTSPEAAMPVALGLSLQRLAELTYMPDALSQRIAPRLVGLLNASNLKTPGLGPCPGTCVDNLTSLAALAIAVRGLHDYANQLRLASSDNFSDRLSETVIAGLDAIAHAFQHGASGDRRHQLVWAIILWQLGDMPGFRQRVPLHLRREILNQCEIDTIDRDLKRLALAIAA